MEIWKDIPGYEGRYQVSDAGNVRSLPRVGLQRSKKGCLHSHKYIGRVLKPRRKESGHLQVQLNPDGNFQVHRLVMLAFVGPCPEGNEVCHNDNNPANNRLDNLRYDTRHGNRVDMIRAGNQGRQKLSVAEVQVIRDKLMAGVPVTELAAEYGVCYTTIWNIKKGVTFTCIE